MSDIFISYASQDQPRVQVLVEALEQNGWSVWWDKEIPPGKSYDEVIEAALNAASCVIVVWSKYSVTSRWIKAEANEAANRDILVPVLIDDIPIPLAFRPIQAARLADWHENLHHPEFLRFLATVERIISRPSGKAEVEVERDAPPKESQPQAEDRFQQEIAEADRIATERPIAKAASKIAKLVWRAQEVSPQFVFFGAILLGFLLVVASFLVGVAFYPAELTADDGSPFRKEIGFVWAINWSVTYVAAFPAIIFLILVTFQNVETVLHQLVRHNMVVGQQWRPVSEETIFRDWRNVVNNSAKWALLLSLISFAQCMTEWYFMTGGPLMDGAFPPGFDEMDWSVAALLTAPGREVSPTANALFSLAAYLAQGMSLAIILSFYAFLFALSNMIYRYARQSKVVRLIPDVNSNDTRRGFQAFQLFFKNSSYVSMIVFFIFYMMHIQNLYLRTDAPDILEFSFGEIKAAFDFLFAAGVSWPGLSRLAATLFTVGGAGNFTSAMAIFLGFVLALMVLFGPVYVLNFAARQSRNELRSYLESEGADISHLTKLSREECLDRLDDMDFWPMKWPRLNHLIAFLIFAFGCLIFYRLGLLFIAVMIILALTKLFQTR